MSRSTAQLSRPSRRRDKIAQSDGRGAGRAWLAAKIGLIVVAALFVYWPSIHGEFALDDNMLLTDNASIKSPRGLVDFWSGNAVDYWPVTNSTLWIEWRLWGLDSTGYHVTNLLLHIADSLLVWLVLRRLGIPGAFLAGLLFAVHPVNVESVAWIAQRKNVLALFFFLLSIFWYLKSELALPELRTSLLPKAARLWYALSFAAFLLSMLSKGSVAILPAVLVLLIWWRRPVEKSDWLRTAPFFVLAAVLTIVNMKYQIHGEGPDSVIRDVTWPQRLLGAGGVIWFYLYKAVLPIDLAFIYPQWQVDPANWQWWAPLIGTVAVSVALWRNRIRRWGRALALAWAYFCLALLPVMGFTDVGFMKQSLVADHYQHIAIIAPIALAAAGWWLWKQRAGSSPLSLAAWGAAVLAVAVCAELAQKQSELYETAVGLYEATVKMNPASAMGHYNLGQSYLIRAQREPAVEHFRIARRLDPKYAIKEGASLVDAGLPADAMECFPLAVETYPKHPAVYHDYGIAEYMLGQTDAAIEHFEKALSLATIYPDAHTHLGLALKKGGKRKQAIEEFRKALKEQDDNIEARQNLELALREEQQMRNEIEQLQAAVAKTPGDSKAHKDLAIALREQGRVAEAIAEYEVAARLSPDDAELQNNLAEALLADHREKDALPHIERAVQLAPDNAQFRAFLAISYKQMGRDDEALATARKALELAKAQKQSELVEKIEGWLGGKR